MTMRLDLRVRHQDKRPIVPSVLVRPDCYGCADCGKWFQFARQLVLHVCPERDYEEDPDVV